MKEDLRFLARANIILDANVLIDGIKFFDESSNFFEAVQVNNCCPLIDSVVEFEFFRGARNAKEESLFLAFIAKVFGVEPFRLPIPDRDTFKLAQTIAKIAFRSENKPLDFADCLIAANCVRYARPGAEKVYLATQNHADFPPAIFDRKHVVLVPLPDGRIKTIGIYAVNEERLKDFSS